MKSRSELNVQKHSNHKYGTRKSNLASCQNLTGKFENFDQKILNFPKKNFKFSEQKF